MRLTYLGLGLVVAGMQVAAPSTANGQTTTLVFASFLCPPASIASEPLPYVESGYEITGSTGSLTKNCTNGSAFWAGSPGVFSFLVGGTFSLFRVDGGTFGLESIDLAQIFASSPAGTFQFIGHQAGGGTVTSTIVLPAEAPGVQNGFSTYAFDSGFDDLVSVDLPAQNAPSFQFNNVKLTATPEPGSLALAVPGLLGLAFVGRGRLRRRS